MLSVLRNVIELDLPRLLERRDEWQSVHVTYHPPRVERLWIQHGSFRVFLHRIHPCRESDALFHPHPWPSAVRVVSGRYEMGVAGTAFDPDTDAMTDPPAWDTQSAKIILVPGSEYEMTERQGWHYVRPIDGPSDSVMVTGPPYDPPVEMPSAPTEKQGPLSPERFDELFDEWKARLA